MSTREIEQFGPNTHDFEVKASLFKDQKVGSEYEGGTVIAKPLQNQLRVCYSRSLENCFACVHSKRAKAKNCQAPQTSK